MNIQYIGEHLIPGQLGFAFIITALVTAFLSFILYGLAAVKSIHCGKRLKSASRISFYVHAASVIAISITLYYIIFNHYFEYKYAWDYSSRSMSKAYMISCFWAGQEGSFLIWGLWQAIIGLILLRTSGKWETPVMAIFSLAQFFVVSFLLGIEFLGIRIGNSPFVLLREGYKGIMDGLISTPNYLATLPDGNGLNPLLENIWMTIHPPMLFLGYALTLVPYSFGIASLLKKDYSSWITRSLPWAHSAILMLGMGILMGGAWAYNSLTFGGFWSWDPVENASFVPWIVLVGGVHLMLVSRRNRKASISAYLFIFLAFILVIYASFLTRSGILSDTSAHSFGKSELVTQMVIYLAVFFFLPIVLIFMNLKQLKSGRQEILFSKEFWIFSGTLVLILSAFQIIFTTSIPVFNSLFGTNMSPPIDSVGFYNKWQTPYALIVALFIAFSMFVKFGSFEFKPMMKKAMIPLGSALVFTLMLLLAGVARTDGYLVFVIALAFGIAASVDTMIRSKIYVGPITHTGFLLFIMGAILTFSQSEVISKNDSIMSTGHDGLNENLVILRNDTVLMGDYGVTYTDRKVVGNYSYYSMDFMKYGKDSVPEFLFSLHPSVNRNPRMGNVYNPDTKHYLSRDVYMYIVDAEQNPGKFNLIRQIEVGVGDSSVFGADKVVIDSMTNAIGNPSKPLENLSITAFIKVIIGGMTYHTTASYGLKDNHLTRVDGRIPGMAAKIIFQGVSPDKKGKIKLDVGTEAQDSVVVKTIINPNILILWIGGIITFIGFAIALFKRIRR